MKDDLDDLRKEVVQQLRNTTPWKRAQIIIENYLSIENPDENLKESFQKWLLYPENIKQKCALMRREFYKILDKAETSETDFRTIQAWQEQASMLRMIAEKNKKH